MALPTPRLSERERNLLYLAQPKRWAMWPFLPLVKRLPNQPEAYGVLFDALGSCGLTGYSATVLFTNLFLLPDELDQLLTLPREVFDAPEEVFDAGWRVD
jgi:hypothetical protein